MDDTADFSKNPRPYNTYSLQAQNPVEAMDGIAILYKKNLEIHRGGYGQKMEWPNIDSVNRLARNHKKAKNQGKNMCTCPITFLMC